MAIPTNTTKIGSIKNLINPNNEKMKKHFSILKNNATKLAFAALLFFVAGMQQVQAQYNTTTIKIGSVANSRWNDGYTFGGQYMSDTKLKLENPANFGTGGTVSNPITITQDFAVYGSINATSLAPYDVLFIGYTATPNGLTAAEINAIKTWTLQAGKVVIVAEQPISGGNPLSAAYGYPTNNVGYAMPTVATAADATTIQAFSGPFGTIATAAQAGGAQGTFPTGCFSTVFGRDANGKATLIFDAPTRDILLADGDYLTNLSGAVSFGNAVSTAQDKFIVNIFAWAVRQVLAPGVAQNNIRATASCTGTGVGTITFTSPIGNSSGGAGFPYSYSIDNGVTYQASPTFNNVSNGTYTIYSKTEECAAQSGGTVTVSCTPCPAGTTAPPVN